MIPIYKAKKIDNDEYVEGDLICYPLDSMGNVDYLIKKRSGYTQLIPTRMKIDLSTLAISFNNGKHWRSIEQVTEKWSLWIIGGEL